ncbi:hypothetical protein C0995_014509 [Termitomyces sp. Mi166|nr:hypothetical protein C0995_014509 [Termitomyces sp. Mi166\
MSGSLYVSQAPPLPPGWTEYIAPGGQVYYYNSQTKESTYVRPIPAFPILPTMQSESPKKKEKPLVKTPIPGTEWFRVRTTEGNIFYSHKARKESVWAVPEEIRDAVEALQKREQIKSNLEQSSQEEREQTAEIQRIKEEVQSMVKRKAEESIPPDEIVVIKKAKVEDAEEDDGNESDESEEEDWEREAAAQLAAEAEEKIRQDQEKERLEREAEAHRQAQLHIPDRVDLSNEEAKALFKASMNNTINSLPLEKDINPLHPWDTSLPKFVSDPRYVLLSSVSARREAFDEYCRERARELRQSTVKKEKETDAKEDFEQLLLKEVKSTRASWTDFRRTWKKDRAFYGWGRDDREREKRFREYLKELGEKKRSMAQKAEMDFFSLLREKGDIKEGSPWKDVKRKLYDDPRYDAVGSSSLRGELYNTYMKSHHGKETGQSNLGPTPLIDVKQESPDIDEDELQRLREEKKEQAVKEREQKVKLERERLEADIGRSRNDVNLEEGERNFRMMLVDAIRDPQMTWDGALPQLKTDPRFRNSPLSPNRQLHLFHSHVEHLRSRHTKGLHALFEAHAPTLATRFDELPLSSLLSAPPVVKLGYDTRAIQQNFDKWQRERYSESRKAFDEMLGENSFVEFWGRLGKIGGEGVDGGVKADDADGEHGEGGGGKVDMKALAKNVDVKEVEKVLRNEKRYIMFDHVPEQRESWIRKHNKIRSALGLRFAIPLMRLLHTLLCLSLTVLASRAANEADFVDVHKVKHDYQSDVARLLRWSHRDKTIVSDFAPRDIFLRELVSNANDAVEKLRLTALTDEDVWNGDSLNITIKAVKNEDGKGGRIVISDTGIGMSPEELTTNLGTLAKSGTSEFLAKAEGQTSDGTASGNLIGAFGLGFYSSFLVADRVTVASIPPKSAKVPDPAQYVFSSSADDAAFEIYPDPRGNTLGRGTEVTLFLKPEAVEYLEEEKIIELVNKHSSFSSTFPIYLFTTRTEEVPDEDAAEEEEPSTTNPATSDATETPVDEDEAIVEEVTEESETKESKPPKMKSVIVEDWTQLNVQPPIWARDPKNVSDYFTKPLAWQHFSGDSGSGVSFKAIVYLPGKIPEDYWQQPLASKSKDVKLMVKRTFITSDLGDHGLPKWASWVKVVIDADDLPLNVSRETLQSNRFLQQLKGIIIKRLTQLFTKIFEEDPEKFREIEGVYGSIFKLGAVEDVKNRDKLAALARFTTTQRNETTLDQYLENKKKGQKQIFYLAEMGKKPEDLAQSVFVEKLHARGYEVLLLTEPLDEIMFGNLRQWKNIPFQDVAKAGLKFGDESEPFHKAYLDEDAEEEKEEQKRLAEKFKPLLEWLKDEAKDIVRDVVLSNRLVKSPCAIVAETGGYTANVQKMMAASNAKGNRGGILHEFAMKAKVLEINPRSPLIEGLLRRVEDLPTDEDEKDQESEEELHEVASILIDGALVRSGFEVPDSNRFFTRVDRVLRRSLGVSETTPTDETVKPAPPIDPELPLEEEQMPIMPPLDEEDDGKAKVILSEEMKKHVSIEMEEIDDDEYPPVQHDEL